MSLRVAFAHTIAARAVSVAVMAVGFAVLSRLLPPEAFGHFAVALAIYGLAQVVVSFGLRPKIISRGDDHSADEIAAAAGLSLLIGAVLCGLGLATAATMGGRLIPAPLAAALVPVSLALLVEPFALGPEARLQRELRFGLISVGSVLGVTVDAAVGIGLAYAGFGAAALAGGILASRVAVALLLILCADPALQARPRLRAGVAAWGRLRVWGQRMTLMENLPQLSKLAMIGGLSAFQGAAGLGIFDRAQTIHRILDKALLDGIKPVVLPAFSGALRKGAEPRQLYRAKLDYLSVLCWPSFALIALLAEDLVAVLLGAGWDEAVPIVRILALMGIALPATKMSQNLFIALGEADAFLRIEVTREAIRVPLALAGALVSLEAFAFAYVAGNWLKAIGTTRHLHRITGGPDGGYALIAWRAAGASLAALVGPVALHFLADLSSAATLALSLFLATAGWLAGVGLLRHPIVDELRNAVRRVRGA
ncbi:Polysaccharide biosynthesis protein [Pseudooceanicola batsensis HTCC2597]|uniref:Polysaccharide biosynthesis protein n=1 Tax=Pseudooceanicola batsensis (strain ATCC BAA-863 / DSM 15984 / KCTC 12145 / HTCC2597) TaxID=252305 RepID=A3U2K0_PSEBH|nr:oligosaccharide flippase family protein [Pseudooceanicola batsensis]EAQ01574.1 Polysaccharide biosynthesis protein [Pseudooceanicola batsensis HTCC2597]